MVDVAVAEAATSELASGLASSGGSLGGSLLTLVVGAGGPSLVGAGGPPYIAAAGHPVSSKPAPMSASAARLRRGAADVLVSALLAMRATPQKGHWRS